MDRKRLLFTLLLAAIVGAGFLILIIEPQSLIFRLLGAQKMHQRIIKERDFAIKKAVESVDYQCCIEPPCTMCYMEAGRWNDYTAGTCACDELIAQGKDSCPQCQKRPCETEAKGVCETEKN